MRPLRTSAGGPGRASRNPVPPGQVGEVVHRSPHAALGYFHDEEKTAEAFRGGWFDSGDLGIVTEDGYLSIVDRKKDMIKTGGERTSPVASRGGHLRDGRRGRGRRLRDRPSALGGGGHRRRRAQGRRQPDHEDIRAHAKQRLAAYKRPKYVLAAELPKNPSGKIVKRELRQQYAGLAHED